MWSLIPLLLGFAAVIQGSINRRIAVHWGLPPAVMLTNVVAFVLAVSIWLLLRAAPGLLPSLVIQQPVWRFSPWFLLPGISGCAFLFGMPIAFGRLGVFPTLLLLIAAQLVCGLLWDRVIESRAATPVQLLGAALTVAGAALILRR